MTVTGRSPEKKAWYLDCPTMSHISRDQQEFVRYMQYGKSDVREIHNFAGWVTGKAIGYGDVWLRLQLRGYRQNHEVVVRNLLHIEGAHNSLSQLQLMGRKLLIVPVNGYGINIQNKLLIDRTPVQSQGRGWGRGNLVGATRQIWWLFRVDVKIAEKRHRAWA